MSTYLLPFLALLEKMAVIVAAAFILSAARPFQNIVLKQASWLRRAVIVVVFSLISIWGSHLGLEILGRQANNRAVGILVAGLIGGPLVGPLVGLLGGAYFAYLLQPDPGIAPMLVLASVTDGLLSGLWGTRHRASQMRPALAFLVAMGVQAAHLGLVGVLLLLSDSPFLEQPVEMHLGLLPELLENAMGVALFVAVVRTSLRLRETEMALGRQETTAARARFQALQAQIRPHFLFNALSTISYLVRTEPEKARKLLGRLAGIYRYLLHSMDRPVCLAKEVEQVQSYLEIEMARFGERLQVTIEIPEELGDAQVPHLLLQPLVENAVKHGIAPLPEGGRVLVRASAEGQELFLQVQDDGVGYDGRVRGTGLSNVAQRVVMLGRGRGSLRIEGGAGEGTLVRIRIPLIRSGEGLEPGGGQERSK